jgi:uncharacterized membrane protein
MPVCPHCDAEVPQAALFCPRCGSPMVDERGQVPAEGAVQPVSTALRQDETGVPLPIPENVAGVAAYITPIPAIVFLYLEPFRRNRFVRFHAFQHVCLWVAGLGFAIASIILWTVLQMLPFMRVLVFPFVGLISLAWFFLWLLLVVKAYHHEWFKLPLIGDFAEEWSRG